MSDIRCFISTIHKIRRIEKYVRLPTFRVNFTREPAKRLTGQGFTIHFNHFSYKNLFVVQTPPIPRSLINFCQILNIPFSPETVDVITWIILFIHCSEFDERWNWLTLNEINSTQIVTSKRYVLRRALCTPIYVDRVTLNFKPKTTCQNEIEFCWKISRGATEW